MWYVAISERASAEVRIGELMAQIPKATKGNGSNQYAKNDTAVDFSTAEEKPVTKSEIIKQAGFTQKQAERFQTLAAHPEIVEQAKAEARVNMRAAQRNAREV